MSSFVVARIPFVLNRTCRSNVGRLENYGDLTCDVLGGLMGRYSRRVQNVRGGKYFKDKQFYGVCEEGGGDGGGMPGGVVRGI